MTILKSFGLYIKENRTKNQLTLVELAAKLSFDTSIMSKIENDWRKFPENKLENLAKILNRPLDEVETEYINTDLLLNYGHFKNYKDKILKILNVQQTEIDIQSIIKDGENRLVEFKSSLRFCLKSKKPEKHIEFSVIKNIAAFLNTNGGKVIIGVSDDNEILGLEETDFFTFKENNKVDAFLKHLDNLIAKYFGNEYSRNFNVNFKRIDNKTIAILDITSNVQRPIIVKNLEKNNKEEFYIRRNASAIALTMNEFYSYSKERWE